MNAPMVNFEFAKRFHSLRRQYGVFRTVSLLAMGIVAMLTLWVAIGVCDYVWEWTDEPRQWTLVSGLVAIVVWVAYRLSIVRREMQERHFAAELENSFDGFGQRIRTVLDAVAGRVSGPPEMLSALGHQTLGRWETLNPGSLLPHRRLMFSAIVCLAMIAVSLGLFFSGSDWSIAMRRALGDQVAYTELAVTPGNARILEGKPVEVSLSLSGRTNRDVKLRYRQVIPTDDDQNNEPEWIESELVAEPNLDENQKHPLANFRSGLGQARQPIEYQFITSVGETPVYRIDIQHKIHADPIETVVEPPAYTRLEKRSFSAVDVTVIENSKVQVTIETNHPLSQTLLEIGPSLTNMQSTDSIAMADDPSLNVTASCSRFKFSLPSQDSLYWRFSGSGMDGTPMTPAQGRIRVRRDAPPTISWRDPFDDIRVHTLAEVPMRVQVSDDFGVTESAIVFQFGGEDDFVLTDWREEELTETSTTTTRINLAEILPLESFALSERDYIRYYAYAVDNRGDHPQRVESDVRYIDIRPLRQFYAEIERMPGNQGGGGLLVQLDELIRRERFLINRTRRLVRSGGIDLSRQIGALDRMVASQSELADLTRLLAEFFVGQGSDDVEALSQAEAAMIQAADSLAAAAFDLALVQEDDALRALAEARLTIEIRILKNPTPAQIRAMARMSAQLRQKLRRERPETEREIADTLSRLADQQYRIGETAKKLAISAPVNITDDQPSDNEPNGDDPAGKLYTEQVDLVERLAAIVDSLSDRLDDSELMSERMQASRTALDQLASAAHQQQFDAVSSDSTAASDNLREMSVQLEALSASEPVSRVSAIRDMAMSLANLEVSIASSIRQAKYEATEETAGESDPSQLDQSLSAMHRIAKQLSARSETIDEVLKTPSEIGDVELSEVNDHLLRLREELDFDALTQSSREAMEQIAVAPTLVTDDSVSENSMQRAVEYATAWQRLDELYRQLVAPRIATLQKIENRANALASQINGKNPQNKSPMGNGGERQNDLEQEENEPDENKLDTEMQLDALKKELRQAGLTELAEVLERPTGQGGAKEEDSDQKAGSEQTAENNEKESQTENERAERPQNAGASPQNHPASPQLLIVVDELRRRIQEMILMEISADRNAPVPMEYRDAVDNYFRAIAGPQASMNSSLGATE